LPRTPREKSYSARILDASFCSGRFFILLPLPPACQPGADNPNIIASFSMDDNQQVRLRLRQKNIWGRTLTFNKLVHPNMQGEIQMLNVQVRPPQTRLVLALFLSHLRLNDMAQSCRIFERKPSGNFSTRFSSNTLGNLIHWTRVKLAASMLHFDGYDVFED
jgi:hypothetical protein